MTLHALSASPNKTKQTSPIFNPPPTFKQCPSINNSLQTIRLLSLANSTERFPLQMLDITTAQRRRFHKALQTNLFTPHIKKHPLHEVLTAPQKMIFYDTTGSMIILQIFLSHAHPVSRNCLTNTKCHLPKNSSRTQPRISTHHQPALTNRAPTLKKRETAPFPTISTL
ncbi:hypothetical protein BM1374166_01826 [Bartonella tribocorum]|nr:hypothetical protein BM1374166_01826 [Bartonella tribocorum]